MSAPTRPKNDVKAADRAEVLAAKVCRYCSDMLGPFEVEHVIPLSRGGTNGIDNLVCACVSCNTQKSNLLLHEWMQWRKANGMCWPPVASHSTDPRHFMDFCEQCRDDLYDSTPDDVRIDPQLYIFAPYRLSPDGAGYRCYYHCPKGHRPWTCWYGTIKHYYSDCSCSFCVMCRMEAEA